MNLWHKIKSFINKFKKWIIGLLIGSAVASGAIFGLLPNNPSTGTHIYVAPWEWRVEVDAEGFTHSYWRCPYGDCLALMDLRTLPQMGKAGPVAEGYGFFVYNEQKIIISSIYLGTDGEITNTEGNKETVPVLNRPLTEGEKTQLKTAFRLVELSSNTPLEFMWDMLTKYADPTGQTAPKPLTGSLGEEIILYLGDQPVKSERFDDNHRQRTIAVFQEDYKDKRTVEGGIATDATKKWTGDMAIKMYGKASTENAKRIVPTEYKNEANLWKLPETVITEDWDCANSTSMTCDLTWDEYGGGVDITSNQASHEGLGLDGGRASSTLSTADMKVEVTAIIGTSSSNRVGVSGRWHNDENTHYTYLVRPSAGTPLHEISKYVTGTQTSLATSAATVAVSNNVIRIEIIGSVIQGISVGPASVTVTDTSITGNTYAGIYGEENAAGRIDWDNFQAEDWSLNAGTLHQRVDTFTSNGSWVAPAGVTSLTKVETWGAGGGGTTNVGGGGGGAYAASTSIAVVVGDTYDIVVGTATASANGASSSFATSTETFVHAEGGLNGTNGCTGGLAASGTGVTTFSGGNGNCGTGSRGGGSGAGDSENGTNNAGTGAVAGGAVNGGYGGTSGSANPAGVMGGGGGSNSTGENSGGKGEVRITYNQGTPDNYAYITDRSYNRSTVDQTSHSITMPSGIVSGDLLLSVFTNDGTATSSPSSGWTELDSAESDANQQAIYYKTAEGSDTLTVTTSASEASSYIVFLIKNGGTPTATAASSTTGDSNPPSHNTGSSAKYLWIVTAGTDGGGSVDGNTNFVSPAGYTDFIWQPVIVISGSTIGAVTAVSNRFAEKQTEDPATWDHDSISWVSFTIAVPFLSSAAAATGSGSTGTFEY